MSFLKKFAYDSSPRHFLIILFCCALAVRLGFLYFLANRDPRGDAVGVFSSDSATYFTVVSNVIERNVFSMSEDTHPLPDNYRTPGYVFFLYPFVKMGMGPWVIAVIQDVCAAGMLVAAYVLARRLVSENMARFASLLYAFEPFTARMSNLLTATGLFMSFFPLVALLCALYIKEKRVLWLYSAAVLLGYCALIKPVASIFFPFLAIAAFLGRESGMRWLVRAAVALLFYAALIAPWLVRNKVVLNTWQFSTVTSYVLYDSSAQLFRNFYHLSEPLTTEGLINTGYNNDYLSQENLAALRESGEAYILAHPFKYAFFHIAYIPRLFIQDQYLDMFQKEGTSVLPHNLDLYSDLARLHITKVARDLWGFAHNPYFFIYLIGKVIWLTIFVLLCSGAYKVVRNKDQRLLLGFIAIFLLWYGAAISPLTRAGHRTPVNFLVFLLAAHAFSKSKAENAKKKICYVLPELNTHTHFTYNVELVTSLKNDADIYFIIDRGVPGSSVVGVPVHVGRSHLFRAFWRGYRNFYIHYSFISAFFASLLRPFGAKVFYWNAGLPWQYQRSWLRRCGEQLVYAMVTFLVTGTESLKKQYGEHYRLPLRKIKVLPNWINVDGVEKSVAIFKNQKNELKKALHITPEQKILLFVHRLSKRKGAHYLPEILRRTPSDTALLVVGDGPDRENIEAACNAIDKKRVRFLGWQSSSGVEVLRAFAIADVFVLPSEEEGFPHVMLEAMAAGIPFVAFGVGGVQEIVPPEYLRYVYSLGDIEAFCDGIKEILRTDQSKRITIQREWIRQFAFEPVRKRFLELFD